MFLERPDSGKNILLISFLRRTYLSFRRDYSSYCSFVASKLTHGLLDSLLLVSKSVKKKKGKAAVLQQSYKNPVWKKLF